jgi:hypothetical protein
MHAQLAAAHILASSALTFACSADIVNVRLSALPAALQWRLLKPANLPEALPLALPLALFAGNA